MKLGGVDYEETSKRRKTANLRQRRERNVGRDNAGQAGPSHVRASLTIDIDEAGQGDSPAPTDTNDSSNKADASESGMSDCIQEPNNDDLTNAALAADRLACLTVL